MKIAPLIAIVSLVAAAPSFAATMFQSSLDEVGGPTDRYITTSDGAAVATGYAGTGVFSISDAQVTALVASNSFATLFQSFTALTTDNFVTGGSGLTGGQAVPGFYTSISSNFDPTPYIGKTVYTFISNGTNPSTGATQFALISFSSSVINIVADPTSPPVPIDYVAKADQGTLLFGKTGPAISNDTLGLSATTIALQPIPEPSVALLGLLGVAGLVRRRR